MLSRVLAAAKRSGVSVSPMTVAFSLAAIEPAQTTRTIEEGPNYVVQSWGKLQTDYDDEGKGERSIFRYTVSNGKGAEMTICNFGATLLSFKLHGRELTLNHAEPTISSTCYARLNQACYGNVCGRVANRICEGKFSLDGVDYKLAINNGANHLHGGPTGFHRRVWNAKLVIDETTGNARGVELQRTSPDGEEGYPGSMEVTVQYLLHDSDDHALEITYNANVADKRTPVNLTNHTYWNLNGLTRTVHDHELSLNCSKFLPVTPTQIPTGELRNVAGTHFDFKTEPRLLDILDEVDGAGQPGFDHCLVIDRPDDAAPGALVQCAVVKCDGVTMRVATTQPGVQLYTANWVDGAVAPHKQHMAFCLETQNFPDAINQLPDNGIEAVLAPGQTYNHRTVHYFSGQVSKASL